MAARLLFVLLILTLGVAQARSFSEQIGTFEKYVDALPIPPRIVAQGQDAEILMRLNQFQAKIHRDLPETLLWGYNGSTPGPTIEVERGQRLRVHWRNELPTKHILAAPNGSDTVKQVCGTQTPLPDVRTVTHLHGAVVSEPTPLDRQRNNDGWPDAWNVPGGEQLAEYPNDQEARTLWYHDHAMGTTGRNVAAGLVGLYLIHDPYERSLGLPAGPYDIPLMIQARGLNGDGSLYYTNDIANEFYGNAVSVNGKLWPYLDVEPRKYRFRIVNASNARSYALKLVNKEDQSAGPAIYQIGSDSGFLEHTVVLDDPADAAAPRLVLAPAERADVIIDFSKAAGQTFFLHNNQLDPGDHEIPLPQLMMFKVGTTLTAPDTSRLPMQMRPIPRLEPRLASATRQIVLGQVSRPDGTPMLTLNGKAWNDPVTEKPVQGSTEIWEIVNTLSDGHPFHVHLVQFQVLDRTPFDVDGYLRTGKIDFTGAPEAPDPNEMGWKDTVRAIPGHITRIIMRFEPYSGFYVYHCHILEHEDMDMMRPFQVVAP